MTSLPRTAPSEQHIDAAGISEFLRRVADEGLELHSLMVARGGAVVAEGWWEPYSPSHVHLLYSVTKTFTASCIGSLVDGGLVEVDRPVIEYFPWVEEVDDKLRRLTVRHCLNMATGHTQEAWSDEFRDLPVTDGHDPLVRKIFTLRPDEEPGSVFCYNQIATYLLGAVVREVTGQPMLAELRRRILDPLGIEDFYMGTTPRGDELGFTGGHATTEALIRLGLLYLGRGVFGGQRVLSEAWVRDASTPNLPNPEATGDWAQGYGFQMWASAHGYRADGAFGQFSLVLPEHDMVIATTAQEGDMQAILTAVWDCIVPAARRAGSAEADRRLAEELAALRMPPLASDGGPGSHDCWRRDGGNLPDAWSQLCLRPSEDGASLVFKEVGVSVLVGDGVWSRSSWERDGHRAELAASGGWQGGEFVAEIRVLHTPHAIRVRTSGETFDLAWVRDPLNSLDPFHFDVIPAGA